VVGLPFLVRGWRWFALGFLAESVQLRRGFRGIVLVALGAVLVGQGVLIVLHPVLVEEFGRSVKRRAVESAGIVVNIGNVGACKTLAAKYKRVAEAQHEAFLAADKNSTTPAARQRFLFRITPEESEEMERELIYHEYSTRLNNLACCLSVAGQLPINSYSDLSTVETAIDKDYFCKATETGKTF
jgi:hypothetical protein